MATVDRYAIPVPQLEWNVPGKFDTTFRWEYDDGRDALVNLYEKGKNLQWNTNTRIDWSQDLDPENPQLLPDETVSIFGSPVWDRMTRQERANLRRHLQAWQLSQFLHGEQGALICTAKIVQQVPNVDAKFYAATQVMDEARHVETYAKLLHEKFELAYPDHADAEAPPQRHPQRLALGHDLPRHAGADRGTGPRGVRLHPRPGPELARRVGQRLRDAGRGAARRLRAAGAARLLSAADATPSATSARSSSSRRAT